MKGLFQKLRGGKDKPNAAPGGRAAPKVSVDDVYAITKTLGVGTFGTVKECTKRANGTKYAVKIIDKSKVKGKEEMLLSEISVIEKLHHEHLVSLQDKYETERFYYIITDLATGGELFDKIVEKGSYTEKDAASLVRQILRAITYMHSNGIVHRDMKPENILFRDKVSDHILITDFGLSKAVDEGMELQTTCGTPNYAAPEILTRKGHGKPVDMWAIGVITYVLLSGYTPFWGDDQASLFQCIMECDYEFDEENWSQVSSSAKDFIAKLLLVDPEKRLTAEEAMAHVWLTRDADLATADLLETYKKNFNAKRTFKKAVQAAIMTSVLQKMSSSQAKLSVGSSSQLVEESK
ncbi:calcium/calmodulin-dependent protein kinase type 1 [Cladochytrium replicatum]|nr:calcium/calmodulin-dependent protein kinase type 1 [Cladochytrium replicatum]